MLLAWFKAISMGYQLERQAGSIHGYKLMTLGTPWGFLAVHMTGQDKSQAPWAVKFEHTLLYIRMNSQVVTTPDGQICRHQCS
jgi:hypothetical protein